jgi:hypothetical protein
MYDRDLVYGHIVTAITFCICLFLCGYDMGVKAVMPKPPHKAIMSLTDGHCYDLVSGQYIDAPCGKQ